MKVKYSFIVPVYNVAQFLPKCIDSLLAQTYKSYEVIIVDDGSPDSCAQIADLYQKNYPQIIRTIHQTNTGLGGARNHGVELARGDYILFVDGDDFVSPNMLGIIEEYKKSYDDDLLFFDWEMVEERDHVIAVEKEYIGAYRRMTLSEYVYQQPTAWRKVYKASLFQDRKIRFPEKIFYEDLALAPCLVLTADRIGVICEKLYYYVQHRDSIMHSRDIRRILEIIPAFNFTVQFFKSNHIFDKYYKELEWLAVQHVLYYSLVRVSYIEFNQDAALKLMDYLNETFPDYEKNPYINIEDNINESINYKELCTLLKGDYEAFDSRFYRKRRRIKLIKDFVKMNLYNNMFCEVVRCSVSLIIATLFVNLFIFLYDCPAGWIDRTNSTTDAIWHPGAILRHGTEGNGVYQVDHNGYVNMSLPLAEGYTVAIGSSQTQGIEVQEGERYTDILNALLQDDVGKLAVYNVSQDAFYFPDIINGFYAFMQEFPDVANIVIEIGTTDCSEEELKGALKQRGFDEAQLGSNIVSTLSAKKRLVMLMKETFPILSLAKKQLTVLAEKQQSADIKEKHLNLQMYEQLVGQALSLIRSEFGGNLIILYHPNVKIKANGTMEVIKSNTCELFAGLCEKNGIEFVDMTDPFLKEYEDNYGVPYGFSDTSMGSGHLNATGHRLIAQALYEVLASDG